MGLPYQTEDYDEGGGASTINDLVNNSTFSTNNIFTASDVKPPSELAVRIGLDSKPTAELLSYNVGQPIILGSNNSAVISDTVLNHYAVPIPTSGSGAGKIVARNTNNDGWEFVSSTGSSSSLTIDTDTNATSTATKTGQTIGTGIFYQNGSQLRVQYKSSSSNFQDVLIGLFDTTSPVITILGSNPVSVDKGNTYTDAGATALDSIDGDVTSQIQTTGTVDTTTVGAYYITYRVSDYAGNIASAIRTVNVVDSLYYSYDFTDTGNSFSGTTFTFADGRTATLIGSGTVSSWNSTDGIHIGPNYRLSLPTFQMGGSFSIELLGKWGDVSTIVSYQPLFYFHTGESFADNFTIQRIDSSDTIEYSYKSGNTDVYGLDIGNIPTPGTTFEHIVLTFNQTSATTTTTIAYLNGTQGPTRTTPIVPNVTRGEHNISNKIGYGNVRMKYMKFYNRALTSAEAQSLYSPYISPVITILGSNPVSITVNNPYTDAGATALDNIDGDVTSQIQIGGDAVDTTTVGVYNITYTVSDNTGNIATAIRTVNVLPEPVYANYRTSLGELPLTAPSGMITTTNALPAGNDDYTIQLTLKFSPNGHTDPSVLVIWGTAEGSPSYGMVYFVLDSNNVVLVAHNRDDLISPPYDISITTDGQYHTFHTTSKTVNGTRTNYIYLDGSLIASGVLVGPVNMSNSDRNKLWVGDGYAPFYWDDNTTDFEFGEIKDLYIYDVAFYPGSTAPPGWT